ncbi:MAG: HD domain-containing protein [Oscillospiraceae bacterium]
MDRLDRLFSFFREIDKEKQIQRRTYLADASRRENDAEHAWHMAVMAVLLCEYSNSDIDLLKTVTMLLIHDIVEVDAGDTYAYDEAAKATQAQREEKAAKRLFGMLPTDLGEKLMSLWQEFEARETPEAKFARTLDNIQPMMLNDASDGLAWRENAVRLSQILGRNKHTAQGSEQLWDYAKNRIIKPNIEKGNIIPDADLEP